MFFKNKFISFIFLILVSFPLTSFAQEESPLVSGTITSTSLGVVTLAVGVGLGVYTTNQNKSAPVRQIVQFLNQNKNDFRASLHLGSGAVLNDFSRLLGFTEEKTKRLARLLRTHRKFVKENVINDLSIKNVEVLLDWINQEMA